jgi:hypothetical protein
VHIPTHITDGVELVRDGRDRGRNDGVVQTHAEDGHAQPYREKYCLGRTDRLGRIVSGDTVSTVVHRVMSIVGTVVG